MMSPSDEERIVAMVDSFTKTVARNFSRNLKRAKANAEKHYSDEPVDYGDRLDTEDEIKAAFLAAFNIVLGNRDEIIEAYEEVIAALTDTADLDAEQETLENESEVVLGLIQKIISENAQTAMDQEEYNRRYDAYSERFEAARKRLAEIAELRQERNAKKTRIRLFMENMNNHQELVQSFDEELWYSTVDYVTVYEDKRLVFTFRDGRQIEITAELWRAA